MLQSNASDRPVYLGFSHGTARNVFDYLRPLLHSLVTPMGLIALLALFAIFAYGWQGRRGKEVLLYLATLTGMVGYFISPYWNNTLIPPLEMFRSLCKPVFVLAVGFMGMRYLAAQSSLRRSTLRPAAAAYLFLMVLYFVRVVFVAPERAAGGVALLMLLFWGLLQYFRRSIATGQDLVATLSAGVLAGLSFYLISSVQLAFGSGRIVFAGRFCGLASNPQSAGEITASLIPMANYLIISGFSSRWQKILGMAGLVVMLPFLLWTGSRTAMGMTVVALLVMNGVKARRWMAMGAAAILAKVIYSHFFGASFSSSHLLSLQNDRGAVWQRGWNLFLSHPMFGKAGVHILVENSLISVAMGLGIVGLAVLGVLVWAQASDTLLVLRNKWRLDKESEKICDFVLALGLGFASGMLFDAYLLAVATTEAVLLGLVLALTSVACDLVAAQMSPGRVQALSDSPIVA